MQKLNMFYPLKDLRRSIVSRIIRAIFNDSHPLLFIFNFYFYFNYLFLIFIIIIIIIIIGFSYLNKTLAACIFNLTLILFGPGFV